MMQCALRAKNPRGYIRALFPGWRTPVASLTTLAKAVVVALGAVACTAFAADGACDAQATEKKLSGAARTSFVKKCETDAAAASCETQAGDKKLAGAAKTSFVKKCATDARTTAAAPRCETQAADKKLAGAAKTSYVTKCVADATK
jgi:hypothetical protein